jgi:Fe-Mn family superoxide dismutase
MSAETLRYHHDKHHDGYVKKLNDAVAGTDLADVSLEEIIQETARKAEHVGVFNNAAQVWNHSFFWQCMTPDGGGRPDGELARQFDADFGSFDAFEQAFQDAATGQFGSGWAWLVLEAGKLRAISTANAEPPMVRGQQALLTCDVWEHAYYLDYQNDRPRFVRTFLDNLVNWEFVAEQFAMQGEGASTAERRYNQAQGVFARSRNVADARATQTFD